MKLAVILTINTLNFTNLYGKIILKRLFLCNTLTFTTNFIMTLSTRYNGTIVLNNGDKVHYLKTHLMAVT